MYLKTIVYAKFCGENKCIAGYMKVANSAVMQFRDAITMNNSLACVAGGMRERASGGGAAIFSRKPARNL